jgi:hypothetical protein
MNTNYCSLHDHCLESELATVPARMQAYLEELGV